ncbi:hypothetical protein Dred_3253 [Desulforamulus reducens MI-1]|uniref:Uncharacterized protein n=1 Tax=Desulforamulus reducens (strain ATCC BAA-1160 / DSM 100696 / MI-1) TaxID=349161 RepID=A4J9K0_DESRM|nr:hypothetical protein Dred_3253 [Desulforamulus reducens MI-1]
MDYPNKDIPTQLAHYSLSHSTDFATELAPARSYIIKSEYETVSGLIGENIQAIFVASSKELDFYSQHKADIAKKTGAKVFTNEPDILKICSDKWLTVNFLKEHGFNYPLTLRYPEDQDQIEILGEKLSKLQY